MRQFGRDGRSSGRHPIRWRFTSWHNASASRSARVETMRQAGVSVDGAARRLGGHHTTVHREPARGAGRGSCDAEAAPTGADGPARCLWRPSPLPVPCWPRRSRKGLKARRSPPALAAEPRAEGLTERRRIHRACHDPAGHRGLPQGSWRRLPRRGRNPKPRGRTRESPARGAGFEPVPQRRAGVENRREAGHREGDLIIGRENRSTDATLMERRPPHPARSTAPRPRRGRHRRRGHRRAGGAGPSTWSRPSPGARAAR